MKYFRRTSKKSSGNEAAHAVVFQLKKQFREGERNSQETGSLRETDQPTQRQLEILLGRRNKRGFYR